MTLIEFRDLLRTVCNNVSHGESRNKDFPRIIYTETGRNYYIADNSVKIKKFNVDVHFYTTTEFDPIFENLEDLFSDNGIPFDLAKIDHGSISERGGVTYYLFKCEV